MATFALTFGSLPQPLSDLTGPDHIKDAAVSFICPSSSASFLSFFWFFPFCSFTEPNDGRILTFCDPVFGHRVAFFPNSREQSGLLGLFFPRLPLFYDGE